ncbi:DNA-directed RNA polymerase specialized sigma24 family protein [Arthrobacter sp. TE12231]
MSGAETPARRKMTAREAAELMGCTPRHIRRVVAEPRHEFLERAAARREGVLTLRGKGLKYREIADELGLPLGTVKTIIHQAKVKQAS